MLSLGVYRNWSTNTQSWFSVSILKRCSFQTSVLKTRDFSKPSMILMQHWWGLAWKACLGCVRRTLNTAVQPFLKRFPAPAHRTSPHLSLFTVRHAPPDFPSFHIQLWLPNCFRMQAVSVNGLNMLFTHSNCFWTFQSYPPLISNRLNSLLLSKCYISIT